MFIDHLESRQLLAGNIEFHAASAKLSRTGTLFVTGTSVRDTITVKSVAEMPPTGGTGKISVEVLITSKYAGGDTAATKLVFPQSDVKRINISSGGGNDLIVTNTGIHGRTVIRGGKGNDRLETTGKSNSLFGDSGDDVLTSNISVSSINVGSSDPNTSAERAIPLSFNLLSGGDGNDTFRTRGGDDSTLGGTGNDRYEPSEAGIATTAGTTLSDINYPSGTYFGTSRIAIDSVEVLAPEPSDLPDMKAYLTGR